MKYKWCTNGWLFHACIATLPYCMVQINLHPYPIGTKACKKGVTWRNVDNRMLVLWYWRHRLPMNRQHYLRCDVISSEIFHINVQTWRIWVCDKKTRVSSTRILSRTTILAQWMMILNLSCTLRRYLTWIFEQSSKLHQAENRAHTIDH